MSHALFAEKTGYYTNHITTVGRRGDFSTSATVDTLLGRAIANWISSHPTIKTVIEIGAGDGSLMQSVRNQLGWWERKKRHWLMVEKSPVLAALQQQKLGKAVRWMDSIETALQAGDGESLIYHNELVDAFPVKWLQWNSIDNRWDEVFLIKEEGRQWKEQFQKAENLDETRFTALKHWRSDSPPPHPSQRVALHASYDQWLASWAPHWKQGAMLTMDYGDIFPGLYYRRPSGTVRAYWRHQMITGQQIYERMGQQDITTDVNFTDLKNWGQMLNWETVRLITQSEFLAPLLTGREPNPAEAFLMDENGAGSAFKVLEQRPLQSNSR